MKALEMRELTEPEIRERITQAQEELFRLRFRSTTQALENPALLRALRRDVARLRTILRERELGLVRVAPPARPRALEPEAETPRRRGRRGKADEVPAPAAAAVAAPPAPPAEAEKKRRGRKKAEAAAQPVAKAAPAQEEKKPRRGLLRRRKEAEE
ncbi:MAG: 50S ribosomal protein L29 [Gemmatimonadetes bacterium]|nr:50S ribosomal protein L29 [Gemmatimonadota bacterium]